MNSSCLSRIGLSFVAVFLILVGCTKGVVPSYSIYGFSFWPFVDGGAADGSPPYILSPSQAPVSQNLNGQLLMISARGSFGGFNSFYYNGNENAPTWFSPGSFSEQTTPGLVSNPSLAVLNSNAYSAWIEVNTGTNPGVTQVHVAELIGTTWTGIDQNPTCGGVSCTNSLPTQSANSLALVSSNLGLSLFWSENFAGINQIRGVYSTTGGTTPGWTPLVSGVNSFANLSGTNSGFGPQAVAFNSKIYLAWAEYVGGNAAPAQIQVAVSSDGINFQNVSGGLSAMSESDPAGAMTPYLAVNNNKLYIAWVGYFSGISLVRGAVYNGNDASPSWAFIDGGGSLNIASSVVVSSPQLISYNNQLFATWIQPLPSGVGQVRLASYNGNDASPSWQYADGGGTTGLNFNTNINALFPTLINFNGHLYSAWEEFNSGSGLPDLTRVRHIF